MTWTGRVINMRDDRADKPSRLSSGQILNLVTGVVACGILLGIRTEFEQVWLRALVAVCAGGALVWAFLQARNSKA